MVRRALLGNALVFVVLSLAPIAGAGDDVPQRVRADLDHLKALLTRDPEKEARSAIAEGRMRFLGVAGYVVEVPGVDESNAIGCVATIEKVDIIRGTSDVIYGEEHMALIQGARKYAARYNAIIARHRGFRLPPDCRTPNSGVQGTPGGGRR